MKVETKDNTHKMTTLTCLVLWLLFCV